MKTCFAKPMGTFLIAIVSVSFTAVGAGEVFAADLIIQNATLISPERSAALRHATVSIRNGKIEKVSAQPITPENDTPVVDGSGLFLVPGLMDSHLHTAVIPGLGFQGGQRSRRFAKMAALYEQQFERSLLYFGVTQFLDPAAHPAALKRARRRELSPDIHHCGAAPLANGYPAIFMDRDALEYSLPYRVYESDPEREDVDRSLHTPEAVVERMRAGGAICLKLFFEDGWGPRSDWPMLSDDSLERLMRAAHDANLVVIGHANALDMQQLAVKAGVDVLGHGLWNWNQYRKHQGIPEEIRRHFDGIREAGIAYQPTLRVMDSMRELFLPATLDDPALKKVVPQALLDWYRTAPAHAFKRELVRDDFDGLPDHRIPPLLGETIGRGERSLRYLAQTGHDLLLASDHPATPGHANHPGLSTYQELVRMAALGVPLKSIFEAATINSAEKFGLADRYGSIESGKTANLLLLEANPLETVEAYDRIRWVVLGGRALARDTLAADYLKQ